MPVNTDALTPIQKALRLQRRVFKSLQAEAKSLLGKTPSAIKLYERQAKRDFRFKDGNEPKSISKADLLSRVRNAEVTFIADFHTFDQAQRTALRIIREASQNQPNDDDDDSSTEWAIGLEMISTEFQEALDDFQNGRISLEKFHETVSYETEWGFPWRNYAPIFEWAKSHGIKIIALNRPKETNTVSTNQDLHLRDEWAAAIITDIFKKFLNKNRLKMIVLYGDLHVASQHLPRQLEKAAKTKLKRPLSWITVHQNEESLFWKLAEQDRALDTTVLQLQKNIFSVFSSTPWAKLQSLVSWLEGDAIEAVEATHDHLSTLRTFGKAIAEFLNVPAPSYESLSTHTMDELDALEKAIKTGSFTKREQALIRFHVNHHHRFYIPKIDVAYLATPSPNGIAEMASIHLLKQMNSSTLIFSHRFDDFYRLILESTFGFFGSLLLNHRRKCDLPHDHFQRLNEMNQQTKRPALSYPMEREARTIVLDQLDHEFPKSFDLKTMISKKRSTPAIFMGARYLGQILGSQLHQCVLSEKVDLQWIREIFLTPPDEKNPEKTNAPYETRYQELLKITSRLNSPTSKTEAL